MKIKAFSLIFGSALLLVVSSTFQTGYSQSHNEETGSTLGIPGKKVDESAIGPGEDASENDYEFNGYFSTKYIYRKVEIDGSGQTSEETDQDLIGQFRMDVTMPQTKKYEYHFFGTVKWDLDGDQDRTRFFPFEGISDTQDSAQKVYIYEAHFDINYLYSTLTQLRLGRQSGTRDEPIFFDGFAGDFEFSKKLKMTAYGGYAVHFFELKDEFGEDTLGGIGFDYSPHPPTKLSLDYLSVKDIRDAALLSDRKDDLITLKWQQRFSLQWRGLIKGRYINGEERDVKLRSLSFFPRAGIDFSAIYFRQFRIQNELSNEFSQFYDILGQSHPFHSVDLKIRWYYFSDYSLDAGYFQRELLDEVNAGPFNRKFNRIYLIYTVDNFLANGFSTALTGERWKSNEITADTAGIDFGYRFHPYARRGRINFGSYYSLYKYDYYIELGERTEVRTYYVNGKLPLGKSFSINGGYEYEDAVETYQRLTVGGRYVF